MKIDWLTVRVIGRLTVGFLGGMLLIAGLISLLILIFWPDSSQTITTRLDQKYYVEETISGLVTSAAIRKLKVYAQRPWWKDEKPADISMYVYGKEKVRVGLQKEHLKLYLDESLKLDTFLLPEKCLYLTAEEWAEKQYSNK